MKKCSWWLLCKEKMLKTTFLQLSSLFPILTELPSLSVLAILINFLYWELYQ